MSQHDIRYYAEDHLWSFKGLPVTLLRPRGKPLQVHLNAFINLASRIRQNSLKQRYTKILEDHLTPAPLQPYNGRVKLLYVYYAPSKHIRDLDNMTGVVMKFTNDALVKSGFLVDDNTAFIQNIHLSYGGLDPDKFNHCDLHIFKDEPINELIKFPSED